MLTRFLTWILYSRAITWVAHCISNPCRFFHRWSHKDGKLYHCLSNNRLPGDVLAKDPPNGWYRWERRCHCGEKRQRLFDIKGDGTTAEWRDL